MSPTAWDLGARCGMYHGFEGRADRRGGRSLLHVMMGRKAGHGLNGMVSVTIQSTEEYQKAQDELRHLAGWLNQLQQSHPAPAKGLTAPASAH